MQGGRLPVHHFAWKYLPFALGLHRIAGRISMLVPIIFMLLLTSWLLQISLQSFRFSDREFSIRPSCLAALLSILTILAWFCLPDTVTAGRRLIVSLVIRKIPTLVEHYSLILGLTTLLVLFLKETTFELVEENFEPCITRITVISVTVCSTRNLDNSKERDSKSSAHDC